MKIKLGRTRSSERVRIETYGRQSGTYWASCRTRSSERVRIETLLKRSKKVKK